MLPLVDPPRPPVRKENLRQGCVIMNYQNAHQSNLMAPLSDWTLRSPALPCKSSRIHLMSQLIQMDTLDLQFDPLEPTRSPLTPPLVHWDLIYDSLFLQNFIWIYGSKSGIKFRPFGLVLFLGDL